MRTIGDIRQLAGWLEGEGSFTVYSPRGAPHLMLEATSTDEDVIRWAKELFGVAGHIYGPKQPKKTHWTTSWQVSLLGPEAAGWMMTIFPFMGHRRKEQIRTCLATWLDYQGNPGGRNRRANRLARLYGRDS
jgi:hypothetical protein